VEDVDAGPGVDVTNSWLYRGDEAEFRIETNLYTIGQRGGVPGAGVPITIKFQTPDGAIRTAVTNRAMASNNLVDIPVGTSPFATGRFWDSTNAQYSPGTYTIWAECDANNIKDNNPQEGKEVSSKVTVLVTDQNPLITAKVPTTTRTPVPTTTTATETSATTVTTTLPISTAIPSTPPPTVPVASQPTTETGPITTHADGFGAVCTIAAGVIGVILAGRRMV